MTRRHATPEVTETFTPVEIGWLGLLLPFVVLIGAIIAFGNHSPAQVAGSFLLLAPPLVILGLRRRMHRAAAPS